MLYIKIKIEKLNYQETYYPSYITNISIRNRHYPKIYDVACIGNTKNVIDSYCKRMYRIWYDI